LLIVGRWLSQFDQHFASYNAVSVKKRDIDPAHNKAWTDNFLVIAEEITQKLPPSATAAKEVPINREGFLELFEGVVGEVGNGGGVAMDGIVSVLARKG
jgi:hypothetical protein